MKGDDVMSWEQVVQPRLGTTDGSGWCLRFAQSVFGAPAWHESAWIAWQHALGRHSGRDFPTDVAVIVWFEHWGVYGDPPRHDNWGHVAVWIPGRGYLSSPVTWRGVGSQWFSTIEDLERALPGEYVGWSEGINGLRVIKKAEYNPLGEIMGAYEDNRKALRNDMRDVIRRHVPLAEMNSAHKVKGRTLRSNIATEIRRNTRVGYQNRIKNDRAEVKIDKLAARVAQIEKMLQTVGTRAGVATAALQVDERAVAKVEEDARQRLAQEAEQEDAEVEVFLTDAAEAEPDEDA